MIQQKTLMKIGKMRLAYGVFRTMSRLISSWQGIVFSQEPPHLLVRSYFVTRYVELCPQVPHVVPVGSGWAWQTCLFYLELSMALPSRLTSCLLSCPTCPERAPLTLSFKDVSDGDSPVLPLAAVPSSCPVPPGLQQGKAEKLGTVLQFLVF